MFDKKIYFKIRFFWGDAPCLKQPKGLLDCLVLRQDAVTLPVGMRDIPYNMNRQ